MFSLELSLSFQLALQSYGGNLIQQIFSMVGSIFELIDPLFHRHVCDLLLLCITQHCVDSQQNCLHLVKECLIEIPVSKEASDQGRWPAFQTKLQRVQKAMTPKISKTIFSALQRKDSTGRDIGLSSSQFFHG